MKFRYVVAAVCRSHWQAARPSSTSAMPATDRIQHEVDAYHHCGIRAAREFATTREVRGDVAYDRDGGVPRQAQRMIDKMQQRYPSQAWSRFTNTIDDAFRQHALEAAVARRVELERLGVRPRVALKRAPEKLLGSGRAAACRREQRQRDKADGRDRQHDPVQPVPAVGVVDLSRHQRAEGDGAERAGSRGCPAPCPSRNRGRSRRPSRWRR